MYVCMYVCICMYVYVHLVMHAGILPYVSERIQCFPTRVSP